MPASIRETNNPQNPNIMQLQELIHQRYIKYVLHFTQLRNLPSIVQHGLLPRKDLSARRIPHTYNDDIRLDANLDASCLSLSWPNYKMFYQCRTANPGVDWVVIAFSPETLWKFDCAFCIENAASNRVRAVPLHDRKTPAAFQSMFLDQVFYPSREKLGIPEDFPTNTQAEILVFGTIPKSFINKVFVPSEHIAQKCSTMGLSIPTQADSYAFDPRIDWKFW
jgi:hypothetical protein